MFIQNIFSASKKICQTLLSTLALVILPPIVYNNFITNKVKKKIIQYKDLIKTFTEADYAENRVNLHIHTNYSDGCADFNDIISQAQEKGFRYIAIADHNTMKGYEENSIPQSVIPAVEFDCWHGYVFMHLLAYGVDFYNKELQKFFAKTKKETELDIIRFFTSRRAPELIRAIHNAGGIAVLAHPACCWCLSLERFINDLKKHGLDGVEAFYPYERHRGIIKFHSRETVKELADKLELIKTGGTDLHSACL